ncbi:MAG: hypothetical protein HGA42_20230 [Nostocales cyanobacterium W4_Combined_metabat2_030]|nr:hypothetical protein [Nostocales cyanobacterium W4_Combined_metabat2_030]
MENAREKRLIEIQIEVRNMLNEVSEDYIAFEIDYYNIDRSVSYGKSKITVGESYLFKLSTGSTRIPLFSKFLLGKEYPLQNAILHEVGHHIIQKSMPRISALDDFIRYLFFKVLVNRNTKISLVVAKKLYCFLPEEILADIISLKLKRKLNKEKRR